MIRSTLPPLCRGRQRAHSISPMQPLALNLPANMAGSRFGGGALTHASDLDIIYLFTGETSQESNGERPLAGSHYYNRLAQRLSAALSVPTAQGALYDVDTRLRPQGTQGPLVVTTESFAKYQQEKAWTWEHMALTRARVLVGSGQVREELGRIIESVLRQPREEEQLRADVLKMRDEMAQHKAPKGVLDAKLLRGGLVDLEFLIHYLQLRDHIALTPDLRAAVTELVDADLLPAGMGESHDFMPRREGLLLGHGREGHDRCGTGARQSL